MYEAHDGRLNRSLANKILAPLRRLNQPKRLLRTSMEWVVLIHARIRIVFAFGCADTGQGAVGFAPTALGSTRVWVQR
jgi:hypothetical protein